MNKVFSNLDEAVPVISYGASVKGNEIAVEDKEKFVDFSRAAMWLAKEHVFIDRK